VGKKRGQGREELEGSELELAKTAGSPAFFAPELCTVNDDEIQRASSLDIPLAAQGSSSSLELGARISFGSGTVQNTIQNTMKRRKADRLMLSVGKSNAPLGAQIDIWAMGVTLYCLLFGVVPFNGQNEFELFHVITKQALMLPPNIPVSNDLSELLFRMMEKDPEKRIKLEEIRVFY
jgi:serine/threonine protein kinase